MVPVWADLFNNAHSQIGKCPASQSAPGSQTLGVTSWLARTWAQGGARMLTCRDILLYTALP